MPNLQFLERAHVRSNFSVAGSFSMRFNGTATLTTGLNNDVVLTLNQSFVSLITSGGTGLIITGFTAGRDGQRIVLFNGTTQTVLLKVDSASSIAANRIYTPNYVDIVFYAFASKELIYNQALGKWFVIGSDDSLVTPTTLSDVITLANGANDNVAITAIQNFVIFGGGGASANISGFTAGRNGQRILISNLTSYNVKLLHQSTSSSAGNRLTLPEGLSIYIKSTSTKELIYSGSIWLVIGNDDTLVTPFDATITIGAGANNNLAVTNYQNFIALGTGGADPTVTGFAAGREGQRLLVLNNTTYPIRLIDNSASSSAGNKLSLPRSIELTLDPASTKEFVYTSSYWFLVGNDDGITSPSDNVITIPDADEPALAVKMTDNFIIITYSGTPSSFTLSGMVAGKQGQRLVIYNNLSISLHIIFDSGTASAADRIYTSRGADRYMPIYSAAEFIYSTNLSRWVLITGGRELSGNA